MYLIIICVLSKALQLFSKIFSGLNIFGQLMHTEKMFECQ